MRDAKDRALLVGEFLIEVAAENKAQEVLKCGQVGSRV